MEILVSGKVPPLVWEAQLLCVCGSLACLLVIEKVIPGEMSWPLAALTITLLTGIISSLVAAASWRWFESPILSFRRHFAAQPAANPIVRGESTNAAGG